MEIFNANNNASRIQAVQREKAQEQARRAKNADNAKRFRQVLDETEIDAPPSEVQATDPIRAVAANDQEDAHEDREQAGYFTGPPPKPSIDLEG
ncbi:MAG: hypothetical protein ACYTF7_00280 [Planctomycetota bacterium]|jgi:hypothetical protein